VSGVKRNRLGQTIAEAAADSTKPPQEIATQVSFAVKYLIDKENGATFQELVLHLSLQGADPVALGKLRAVLQAPRANTRVEYDPSGANGEGIYKFKPKIPVKNTEDLKRYLQQKDDSVGVKIDDLKDGWKTHQEEIKSMEKANEILVVRNNKNQPRTIWQDDSSLHHGISDELKQLWDSIKLPANAEEIRTKLEAAGLKPTSESRRLTGAGKPQEKKKKAARRGGRQTNSHMTGILRDYSHKRK